MSVTSTTNRKSYAGDAVTTSFATNPVVFFDSSDLAVSVVSAAGVETALTENTHYTVTGGDGSTGTVNLAGGSAPYGAPAAGVTLLILRQLPLTQPVDLVQNGGSDAEVQERAYDRLTMMVQQLNEVDARAIKLPPVETGSTALTELPFDRASKFLAFDASKNLIASSGTVDSAVPVSAFMETVLDDASAAAARTTLGALGSTEAPGAPYTDTNPVVAGSSDATKKVRFEVDGLTTATTRVMTVPDFDGTIATLAGAETLTNKTLTSPAVNAPVINTSVTGTALADQSAMEAAISNTLLTTPGRIQYHPGVAKAWGFVGVNGNLVTGYGISSVTDTALGRVTPNWTTAFSTANYAPNGISFASGAVANLRVSAIAAGSATYDNTNSADSGVDPDGYFVCAFGDQ